MTILVVDDEPIVLNLIQSVLGNAGFEVLAATDPTEALRLFSQHSSPVDLLLSDVRLPTMNGADLADCLRRLNPELRLLFMAGWENQFIQARVLDRGFAFLPKPFTTTKLIEAVRAVLEQPRPTHLSNFSWSTGPRNTQRP